MTEREPLDVAKLGRMHSLLERVLTETRAVDLDPAALARVAGVTHGAMIEIGSAVPGDLLVELARVVGDESRTDISSDELRIIEVQLLGWLHGMARAEGLEQLRADSDAVQEQVGRLAHEPRLAGYV